RVRAGSLRSSAARKPRDRKVKTSPEEVHRAAFANESRPELAEDGVHRQQNPPESLNRRRIVRAMRVILVEGNRIGDFDRHSPNLDFDPRGSKHSHEFPVELGY